MYHSERDPKIGRSKTGRLRARQPVGTVLMLSLVLILAPGPTPAGLLVEPAPLVIYQNDFNKRTSLGPIGGLSTGSYRPGELVSTRVGDTGQDSWVRRHGAKRPVLR